METLKEDKLRGDNESVDDWLARLDGKSRASPQHSILISKSESSVRQTLKLVRALIGKPGTQVYSRKVNEVINRAMDEGGAAIRAFGELFEQIRICPKDEILEPTINGISLLSCQRSNSSKDRTESVVRVILLTEPEQAKVVLRDVLSLNKEDRRILAGGFQGLSGELQDRVVRLTVDSLEPAVCERLVRHPLADIIDIALRPFEEEMKKRIEKKRLENALLGN